MATTTYTSTNPTARTNPALYWGIAAAVVLAIIAFLALRGSNDAAMTPATTTDSVNTAPANTGTVTSPTDTGTTGTTGTNTNMGTVPNADIAPGGVDAKSGSSMNTDTQSNPNNSNTGGSPTTEQPRSNGQ